MLRNRVLVPIDFSEASFEALETALELVDDPAKLHLLFVLPPMHPAEPGVLWDKVDDPSRMRNALEALDERLKGTPYAAAAREVVVGDAGHAIVEHANGIGADLVVIPSHGRTGISRVLLGSVAERVVRLAPCPVLVLRRHDDD